MKKHTKIATINEKHWDKMVREGCSFTQPWLDMSQELIQEYIDDRLDPVPEPLINFFSINILSNIEGKDVLCLASGGGGNSRWCLDCSAHG